MKDGMPFPRIRGNALQIVGGTWGWELNITIGETEPIWMTYPKEDGVGFKTKEEALESLREHAQGVADTIVRDVYKAEPKGYLNLKKNIFEDVPTL
jgi:hypothetical protein